MNLASVLLVLLFVALASCLPLTGSADDDIVNGLRVVQTVVSTSRGGVNHTYWFRRLFATELSAQELACAQNATVFHAPSGRCEWLFEQGPCAARQWLVLDKEAGKGSRGGLRSVCRRRPCAPGYGFLADGPRCAPLQQLCAGDERVFRYSLRGEGRCHCKGFRAQGPDANCHVLFTRGPCPQGQVFVPGYGPSLDSFRGACVPSPCPEDELRVVNMDGSEFLACTSFGELGCSLIPGPLLTAETGAYVPLCDDPIRNAIKIYSRPMRDACEVKDDKGNCVTMVVRTAQPFDWGFDEGDDEDGGGSGGFGRAAADRR